MRTTIKKQFALVAALCVILAAALPALAGGGLSDQYYSLEPGKTYDLTDITLSVPLSDYGYAGLATLYGTDVSGGRIHIAEGQGPYNFVWEQSPTVSASYPYGSLPALQLGYTQIDRGYFQQFPIDGKTLFGFSRSPFELDMKMTFTDVQLTGRSEDLFMYDEYYAVGPYVPLMGKITIEITTTIDGTFTLPEIETITSATPGSDQYISDVQTALEEAQKQIDAGVTDGLTVFDQPKTITATIELNGTLTGADGYPDMDVVIISSQLSDGQHTYSTTIDGTTYTTPIRDSSGKEDYLDQTAFSIDCPLLADARWSVTPYGEFPSSGGVVGDGYGDDGYDVPAGGDDYFDAWLEEMNLSQQNLTNQPAKVALITAGTAVTALSVSIIVSLVGDATASAAASAVSGMTSVAASAVDSAAGSASNAAVLNPTPADLSSSSSSSSSSGIPEPENADAGEPEENAIKDTSEESKTPELPEEDSPEVSMALFAPDKDLLNVKGGAASITVQISGGEGYLWNYLPTVVCPGTLKAIIPTVTGRTHLATLNLGMTGTKLTSRHYEVFVSLIAWTTTPDGKLLKTSKSMEMKLHEPGIEAKKNADGSLTVSACVPTTLKGFADVRTLSPEEYTCTALEDGTLEIRAVDTRLGTTRIKP